MNITDVATQIENKIKLLETHRAMLPRLAQEKARATANYEKCIALTLIKLKNGVMMELEEQTILQPPASIMEKVARGICSQELLRKDVAESGYKSCIVTLGVIEAQLNAWQSVFRYLKEV